MASSALVEYASNPVLLLGGAGTWNVGDCAAPDVAWDPVGLRWWMGYSGWNATAANPGGGSGIWSFGVAYSSDLLTWTNEATNPKMTPLATDGYICCNGAVCTKTVAGVTTYYHFFNRFSGPSGTAGIPPTMLLATSPNLTNGGTWTRQNGGNPVLAGTPATYDAAGIIDPSVRLMADGVTFECVYCADPGSSVRSVRRATSTDGITWTKDSTFNLPHPSYDAGGNFGEPSMFRTGAGIHLLFDWSSSNGVRSTGRAFSSDSGVSWSSHPPALSGSGAGWNSNQVFDASFVLANNKLYVIHAGAPIAGSTQGMGAQLGVATADLLADAI